MQMAIRMINTEHMTDRAVLLLLLLLSIRSYFVVASAAAATATATTIHSVLQTDSCNSEHYTYSSCSCSKYKCISIIRCKVKVMCMFTHLYTNSVLRILISACACVRSFARALSSSAVTSPMTRFMIVDLHNTKIPRLKFHTFAPTIKCTTNEMQLKNY